MPKEVFGKQKLSSDARDEYRAVLKWGREDHTAQIGIETDNWFSFNSDLSEPEIPEYNSLWFQFETRQDFNRMIKTLRRMRDDVFGRD